MEIDEHLKYTLYVTAIHLLQTMQLSLIPIPACNSTLAPEPANPWSRAGRPTTSCNRCKTHQPAATAAAGSVRGKGTGERRPKDFPRKGNPKAFSSTHHATKEKKENFIKNTPSRAPTNQTFDYRKMRERTYIMIERDLTTRPFIFGGWTLLCWGAGIRFLLYYTQSAGKGIAGFCLLRFLLHLAGGLGECIGKALLDR